MGEPADASAEAELSRTGWVVGIGEDSMLSLLQALGQVRGGGTLTPREASQAREMSLSGVYGLGAFPWHTDGAIAAAPPRWIGMYSFAPSQVFTEILEPDSALLARLRKATLRVTDASGQTVMRLACMMTADGLRRLRWDPRACPSGDGDLDAFVEAQQPTGRVEWAGDTWVVLDNFRLLHRRPSAYSDSSRQLRRYYAN